MPLDLTSFAIKWQQTQLTERSAYQQHFRDLCEVLGVPHRTEEEVVGNNYTFEKHVTKVSGGKGYANVWKRDAFAFEYKLPGGDLKKAYEQLIGYHEDLGNPAAARRLRLQDLRSPYQVRQPALPRLRLRP